MTKWGRRPHWELDARFLGSDDAGDWIGVPAGTLMARPGATYVAPVDQVVLVPPTGPSSDRGWLATFHAAGGDADTYIDITTPPYWTGLDLNAVDLDLDVVRGPTGRVWIDDEDEFARHRLELGYPVEIVELALHTAQRVRSLVSDGAAPYDGSAERWFAQLTELIEVGSPDA